MVTSVTASMGLATQDYVSMSKCLYVCTYVC